MPRTNLTEGLCVNATEPELSFVSSLQQSCFRPCLQGRDKVAVITELVDELVRNGLLLDRDGVLASVLEREALMSTGMQYGIALPHGKHESVPGLASVIGISPSGVEFESLDGQPSRIFVMTVSSPNTVGPHLRFLASIGKLLGRAEIRDAVLAAIDKAALMRALA